MTKLNVFHMKCFSFRKIINCRIDINDLYLASSLLKFMFADDTACTASNSNLNELILHVNNELKKVAGCFNSYLILPVWFPLPLPLALSPAPAAPWGCRQRVPLEKDTISTVKTL